MVESNAKLVIDALNSNSTDASSLGLILEDCSLFASELLLCSSANRTEAGSMSGCEGRSCLFPFLICNVIYFDAYKLSQTAYKLDLFLKASWLNEMSLCVESPDSKDDVPFPNTHFTSRPGIKSFLLSSAPLTRRLPHFGVHVAL